MYDYRITIGDSYTLENAPQKDLPYISGAVVNNATSSANRLTIGGTVSDKLVFDIINPPTMELDGLSVKLEIKEVRELSNDDGGDVTLNISDLNEFLDDVQDLPDSPTDDTGADITVDTESMSGEVYEFDTPVGETGDADNDEILENDVYRDDGEDIQGEASADVEPVTEWIEFGTYYITNVVQTSENAVNITALDGFILMGDTFTPAVYNTTATALFEDFAAKVEALGVSVDDATMPEITIHWQGAYTLREAAGLFASLVGGYASFNRGGHLELRQYRKNTPIIQFSDVMAYGSTSAAITINGVACDNSASLVATNWITTGDDDTVELKFKNPYVTAAILPDILAVYLYTVYKPCTVTAPYSYQYEAGDFIQVYTSQDVAEWICITNQTINLDSGLVAIESLGNSETLEANAQESPVDAKFKTLYSEMIEAKYIKADRVVADGLEANKAEIADLVADNLEVGSINGNVIQNGSVLAAALSQEAIQTIGGNKVYYQAEPPTGGTYIEGDTWYKTVIADADTDKKVLHVWNGTTWEPTDFDARILRANTITSQEIAANTIEAGNVNMDNLQTNFERVGDTSGKHIEITNDAINICDGSDTLARFTADGSGTTKKTIIDSATAGNKSIMISANNYDGANNTNAYAHATKGDNSSRLITTAQVIDGRRNNATIDAETSTTRADARLEATTRVESPAATKTAIVTASSVKDGTTSINLEAETVNINSHDITYNGECVTLEGNAGTVTLSTSAANYLTGRCQIGATTNKYTDLYTVSTNPATITVKKGGLYMVKASAYYTTGFTVNDIVHTNVEKQASGASTWTVLNEAGFLARVNNASWYNRTDAVGFISLNAGDTVRMTAYNQTGARGLISMNSTTLLQLVKIY